MVYFDSCRLRASAVTVNDGYFFTNHFEPFKIHLSKVSFLKHRNRNILFTQISQSKQNLGQLTLVCILTAPFAPIFARVRLMCLQFTISYSFIWKPLLVTALISICILYTYWPKTKAQIKKRNLDVNIRIHQRVTEPKTRKFEWLRERSLNQSSTIVFSTVTHQI